MSPRTILTLSNGKGIDLLDPQPADIDFAAIAEHLGKEARYNGATPDTQYSVAQHCALGADAILQAGGSETEAAYFLLHDGHEATLKDDTTPKKHALAEIAQEQFGILADDIVNAFALLTYRHDVAIHAAAGLDWPLSSALQHTIKKFDVIMFVTEWRDARRAASELGAVFRHPAAAVRDRAVAVGAGARRLAVAGQQALAGAAAARARPRQELPRARGDERMTVLTAHCWFGRHPHRDTEATPPRGKIVAMLAAIEKDMRALGYRPTVLMVETWPLPANMRPQGEDCLAKISIAVEPGDMTSSLVCWYEWQHPRWFWAESPMPVAYTVTAAAALPGEVVTT